MHKIEEFKTGAAIVENLVLSAVEVKQTRTVPPRNYLSLKFSDGADVISGIKWNWPAGEPAPVAKAIYTVMAVVSEYNSQKQLTVSDISLCEEQDFTEFVPTVGVPTDTLWNDTLSIIETISNPKIKRIVVYCYGIYKDALLQATSAVGVHHVGVGGNLLHTLEVCRTAEAIYSANQACYYDIKKVPMDLSLIVAGALLHDIGKPFTYTMENAVIGYSLEGNLLEHITIGTLILQDALKHLGDDYLLEIRMLQHIVASHHGELEYGSPVTPKCMEAYVVNFADRISATLDVLNTASNKAGTDILTEKIYTCSNRQHINQSYLFEELNKKEKNSSHS